MPRLNLRPATKEDEKIYRRHWEDVDFKYQWLWYSDPIPNAIFSEDAEDRDLIECLEKMLDREREMIFSDFEKTLKRDNIFIIELDENIIGSIRFLDYCKGDYRIDSWAMEVDDDDLKKSVIEKFASLKLARAKKISICTICDSARKFLLNNGFEQEYKFFYYFYLPKSGSHS